ncbi:hypothetical protein H7Y40_00520 [Pedobacter sp.]|nr:hypothetical protein [Candidatus Saccharibacteria bacterium]
MMKKNNAAGMTITFALRWFLMIDFIKKLNSTVPAINDIYIKYSHIGAVVKVLWLVTDEVNTRKASGQNPKKTLSTKSNN